MLVFNNKSSEAIKLNYLKTLIYGGLVGADKIERFLLLKADPLIKDFGINVRGPENISRFLYNFNFKTTQMARDINFRIFKKLLKQKKFRKIVIDLDSRAVNIEGNQEEAV